MPADRIADTMNAIPRHYLARISEICPDLEVRSLKPNREGLNNDVIILTEIPAPDPSGRLDGSTRSDGFLCIDIKLWQQV